MLSSNAKFIIGTPKTYETIKQAVDKTNKNIGIICIKTGVDESIPNGAIDFAELIDLQSKLFKTLVLRHIEV